MNILKSIWSNIVAASFAMIGAALIHLLVWGEHLKGASTAWLFVFYLVFQTVDVIKWGTSKYRGDV